MMFRVVMRMVHCSHFHSDRDPRSFTDLSLTNNHWYSCPFERCKLAVLGFEVGRLGQEAFGPIRCMRAARFRTAARQAKVHKWTRMLAVAAVHAFAMLLLELALVAAGGAEPLLAEVADARTTELVGPDHGARQGCPTLVRPVMGRARPE